MFPGLNTYTKTWLQLIFPAYVIFLVVVIIIISSFSLRFSKIIGKKDPVGTLATLILFSYANLLHTSFWSLSAGVLEYPDGSKEMVWLPDGTVRYLSGKHIPLFITAIFILLVGLIYTVLLFSWQWLLYLPNWRIFKWSRNQRLQTFIETHHIPYTPRHRYWTGMLLFARAILYLIASLNVSNDPEIALMAITFMISCILIMKGYRIYQKWPIDALERFFLFNILSLTIFTWTKLSNKQVNQEAAAYVSVLSSFILLILIMAYHACTYTAIISKFTQSTVGKLLESTFKNNKKPKPMQNYRIPQSDDDIHRFHDLLDIMGSQPANTKDWNPPSTEEQPTQTYSVVEAPEHLTSSPEPVIETHQEQITITAEQMKKFNDNDCQQRNSASHV